MKKNFYRIKFLSLIFTGLIYSSEAAEFEIKKENKIAFSFSIGPIWRNLKDLESATLISNPQITQKSDFIIKKLKGYVIETEGKAKINKYLKPLISFTFALTKKGYGYFDIYNEKNGKRLNTVEYHTFMPYIKEKCLIAANETELFKKEFDEQELSSDLFLGYFKERDLLQAFWEDDVSRVRIRWQGFIGGFKFDYKHTKKLTLGFDEVVRVGKLNAISSRDSFGGKDPAKFEFIYLGNILGFNIKYELTEKISVGIFFEWERLKNQGNAKIILAEPDRPNLKNPKLLLLKENVYALTFATNIEF